jgi:hypothetical protein
VATRQSSGVLAYIRITRCIARCAAGPPARLWDTSLGLLLPCVLASLPRGVVG